MDDEIRRRMKAALAAKRLTMKGASVAAGFGETYLFDALVGRNRNGVREFGGTLDNFTFIAQIIGLNPRWLATGDGPMWMEDDGKTSSAGGHCDGQDDLVVVIEEALAMLLRLPGKMARSTARSLAAVAKNPLEVSAEIGRTDAIRISVRAILRSLQAEAK
ncbi:hypothetical protein [Methylocella sp.]|jgi:hypothetical protein|uniref:hypothetical protein n=1 Tax=Methylocella sp. TaxID=1978226 RepID=UPI003C15C1D5